MVKRDGEIKVKYNEHELSILQEKAKQSGKNLSDYQRETSKKAVVKIEVNE